MKLAALYLHFHWVSVNLAHILSSVLPLHPPNVERPSVVVVVCDAQPRVVRDHVLVDRQDRLRVRFDPRYLPRQHPARTDVSKIVCPKSAWRKEHRKYNEI